MINSANLPTLVLKLVTLVTKAQRECPISFMTSQETAERSGSRVVSRGIHGGQGV